jgi:hypothetical protein
MTAETGFLGLFCFLWVIFVLLRHSFDCCQKVNGPARMALRPDAWPLTLLQGVLSGLCGLLVQSFFDNTFYTVQLSVLIWLIFGLTVVLVQLNFDSLKE